jgi:hypothetical protein
MNWIITIYSALLFFVLTPGVLLRLPPKSGKFVVAATHAIVFALVWHFTSKIVWRMSSGHEGFTEGLTKMKLSGMTEEQFEKSTDKSCGSGEASVCGAGCYGIKGQKGPTYYCLTKEGTKPKDASNGYWTKK